MSKSTEIVLGIFKYIDTVGPFPSALPDQFAALALVGVECKTSAVTALLSGCNSQGVLRTVSGRGTGWVRTGISQGAIAIAEMSASGRKKFFLSLLSLTERAAIADFARLNAESFDSASSKFPHGTADGICPPGTPGRLAEDSHIIDKHLSRVTGLPEFNRSANVLKECGDVNRARYGDIVTTVLAGDHPQTLRYVVTQDVPLPAHIKNLDGMELQTMPEMRSTYRKAFRLRETIVTKLTPEHKELLKAMKDADTETE